MLLLSAQKQIFAIRHVVGNLAFATYLSDTGYRRDKVAKLVCRHRSVGIFTFMTIVRLFKVTNAPLLMSENLTTLTQREVHPSSPIQVTKKAQRGAITVPEVHKSSDWVLPKCR